MAIRVFVKQFDDKHGIHAVLKRNGQAEDLTDCHVSFVTERGSDQFVDVLNAEAGEVFIPLEATLTDKVGFFKAEFKVNYPDGRLLTYPQNDYIYIYIQRSVS